MLPNGIPVERLVGVNAFVAAVNTVYALHYPLVLTPDAIWMCIAQGLAQHINANAEKLRVYLLSTRAIRRLR